MEACREKNRKHKTQKKNHNKLSKERTNKKKSHKIWASGEQSCVCIKFFLFFFHSRVLIFATSQTYYSYVEFKVITRLCSGETTKNKIIFNKICYTFLKVILLQQHNATQVKRNFLFVILLRFSLFLLKRALANNLIK